MFIFIGTSFSDDENFPANAILRLKLDDVDGTLDIAGDHITTPRKTLAG